MLLLTPALAIAMQAGALPGRPAALFPMTKIWNIHLRFAPEQWRAMEPKDPAERGFGFGPAMLLAPGFLKDGDRDRDGAFSRSEFQSLAQTWFSRWDKEGRGTLRGDSLRDGINAAFPMPGPGSFTLRGREGARNGIASVMGFEFPYVSADLEFDGVALPNVAVRYKGNGTFLESRGQLKRSLKIDLNKGVKGRSLAGVTQLNLHSNVTDPSAMNEAIAYRLYRDAGVPAPRTAYARVFLTVPGTHERQYVGLYTLVEDVGRKFAQERFGKAAGAVLKPVTPKLFDDLGDQWKKYNQTYDPKTDLDDAEKQAVIALCKFVTHADDRTFAAQLPRWFDIDELARYLAVTAWIVELDGILGPGQNLYLHRSATTGKLAFIPWDLDHSFGQFAVRGTPEERQNLSLMHPWQDESPFLERLFRVPAFQRAYRAHLIQLSRTVLRPERIARMVDTLGTLLGPAVAEESPRKRARFDLAVAGKPLPAAGFFPQPPTRPIKAFVGPRAASVDAQLAGKSAGQRLSPFGFGAPPPPGPPGRPAGPPPGPGLFLSEPFRMALDTDKDGALSRDEFVQGFARWFDAWRDGKSEVLTEEQLRLGLNRLFLPRFSPGPPPGPGGEN